jgi:ABC-2 type transport system permease protein
VDLRPALVIAGKDLRLRLRDRSVYLIGVVAPLALALVLSLTVGSGGSSLQLSLGVVDLDGGPVAESFGEVTAGLRADGVASVTRYPDEAAGARAVDEGTVGAVFVLPDGLSSSVMAGGPATLRVIGGAESPVSTQIATSIARGFADRLDADRTAVATVAALDGRPPDAETVEEVLTLSAGRAPAIVVVDDPVAGRGFDFGTFYAIGLSVFFLFFTVQFGVLGLLEERRDGTLARLLASPLRPSSVLVGKLGASVVVGLASMAVLIAGTTVLLGAEWGALLPLVVLVVLGVLSAAAVGALVLTLARTPDQAGGYATMVAVGLGALGGAFFPVGLGPRALDLASRLTPHRWLIDGFRATSFGDGLGDITDVVLALSLFIAVVGGLGLLRARALVERR